ncbi:MAG: hypothetical protein MUO53_02795 [Maribacter sp.]|nr:hypothetical protein [Maribacter sp.]
MEATKKNHRYTEWLNAEEMHDTSKRWMSELKFTRDEQLFLNDLVKSYTLELIDSPIFDESKKIVDTILYEEEKVVSLMKKVQAHENLLEIMVNNIDELEKEKAYTKTHWELATELQQYMVDYQRIKTRLFKLLSKVMKKQKQKRLLN